MAASLRQRLAEHGFESNDDYEFALRLLLQARIDGVRCLNVVGQSGRRKTAFAHALARAIDYPHVLYHDFSRSEPAAAAVIVDAETGSSQTIEAAVSAFDRALTEACAYSEAERVMLILDQLQASDFRDQVRLYQFVQSREWHSIVGSVQANAATLLLVLVSEEPLYHSLQKVSFRLWTDPAGGSLDFEPRDYGLGAEASALFAAFDAFFTQLGQSPTRSEFAHILGDTLRQVRTAEQLRTSVFGWMEGLERERLYTPPLKPVLERVVAQANALIGIEEIEIRDLPEID